MKKRHSAQTVPSKLSKARIMLKSSKLAKHMPSTRRFSRSRLLTMLKQYRVVYAKPDRGSKGIGVIRVERKKGGYRYQSGTRILAFPTYGAMFRSLKRRAGKRSYVIQKGIHVLRHGGRPFDFRIMIQRSPSRAWTVTGTVGRVAHPRKIVSNGSQGGTIYPTLTLLRRHAGRRAAARKLHKMRSLSRLTAALLGRAYPALNELGVDIAVDRRLNPWILEVNTRPGPCPFTKLRDQRPLRRIIRYGRAYGRRYNLHCTKAKQAR